MTDEKTQIETNIWLMGEINQAKKGRRRWRMAAIAMTVFYLLAMWGIFKKDGALKEEHAIRELQRALYMQETIGYNKEHAKLDSVIFDLKQSLVDTVAHFENKRSSYTKTIGRVRFLIAPAKSIPIMEGDTVIYRNQLLYRDTLISYQDSTISTLYAERAAVKVSTDALIGKIETQARLSDQEANKWIGRWQESEVKRMAFEKKMRRQRRLERIGEAALIAGIIIVAL